MQINPAQEAFRQELKNIGVISLSFKAKLSEFLQNAIEIAYKQGLQEQTLGMCFTVKGEDSIMCAMDKFKAQCGKTPDQLRIHPVDIHGVLYYSSYWCRAYSSRYGAMGSLFGMKVIEDSSILDGTAYLTANFNGRPYFYFPDFARCGTICGVSS